MLITDQRRDSYRGLAGLSLPGEVAGRLAALGITTLEELRDHWTYGNRELISRYLGESPLRLLAEPPSAMLATRGIGASGPVVNLLEAGRSRPLVKRPRGVLLTAAQQGTAATAPAGLPPATRRARTVLPGVSLVKQFPAARDQRSRGTCVAFASIAFLEFHLSAQAAQRVARHAEQFVYWACKSTDGLPDAEGTFVRTARDVLRRRGACLNSTWKYRVLPMPGNEGQGPPTSGAEDEAKQARWRSAKSIKARDTAALRAVLDQRRPVVLSVLTFPSWDFGVTAETGEIAMPFPGEVSDGGYGTLYFDYVAKYGLEAFG